MGFTVNQNRGTHPLNVLTCSESITYDRHERRYENRVKVGVKEGLTLFQKPLPRDCNTVQLEGGDIGSDDNLHPGIGISCRFVLLSVSIEGIFDIKLGTEPAHQLSSTTAPGVMIMNGVDTASPTSAVQVARAEHFAADETPRIFRKRAQAKAHSQFLLHPVYTFVRAATHKVLFLGDACTGKSTLLNAVLGEEVMYTGLSSERKTKDVVFCDYENRGEYLVDTPGYSILTMKNSFLKKLSEIMSGTECLKIVYVMTTDAGRFDEYQFRLLSIVLRGLSVAKCGALKYSIVINKIDMGALRKRSISLNEFNEGVRQKIARYVNVAPENWMSVKRTNAFDKNLRGCVPNESKKQLRDMTTRASGNNTMGKTIELADISYVKRRNRHNY